MLAICITDRHWAEGSGYWDQLRCCSCCESVSGGFRPLPVLHRRSGLGILLKIREFLDKILFFGEVYMLWACEEPLAFSTQKQHFFAIMQPKNKLRYCEKTSLFWDNMIFVSKVQLITRLPVNTLVAWPFVQAYNFLVHFYGGNQSSSY